MADPQDLNQSAAKDPKDWTTGDEAATGPQLSYLHTLAQQAGEQLETDGLTKAQASEHIERLQKVTGRDGAPTGSTSRSNDGDDRNAGSDSDDSSGAEGGGGE